MYCTKLVKFSCYYYKSKFFSPYFEPSGRHQKEGIRAFKIPFYATFNEEKNTYNDNFARRLLKKN
jgi:hypothetical protein